MTYLITDADVFDGSGSPLRRADVVVDGNRITYIGDAAADDSLPATVIDGSGTTLMPGLIDGHMHIGFGSTTEHTATRRENDLERTLLVAHAGRVLLDHGFTSGHSGGNRLPQSEVAAAKAFAEGWLPGPRMLTTSWEGSAGIVSPNAPSFPGTEGRESDPGSIRQFVHAMADLGVDGVKLTLTGESALVANSSRVMQFTEEEVAAAAEAAQERGVYLIAHAHSSEAVRLAVKHGVRSIFHVSFADDAAIDALVEARDRIFVAPTPGILYAHLHDEEHPPTPGMETEETIESISRVAPELYKRGVRLLIGGDYGFPFNPMGRNARDLELFVDWFGLSPSDALRCATEVGGQVMGMGDELGLVREGFLADLLLVKGDPTRNVRLLQDPANLALVMKDGVIHRADPKLIAGAR